MVVLRRQSTPMSPIHENHDLLSVWSASFYVSLCFILCIFICVSLFKAHNIDTHVLCSSFD